MDLTLSPEYAASMNRKLTAEQAQTVIDRVAAGEPQKKLAAEFGLTPSGVCSIVNGKSWPDLARPEPPLVVVHNCKLTPADIPVILARLANLDSPAEIAADYGMTRQAIADIRRGKTWSHIPRPAARRRRVWEDV